MTIKRKRASILSDAHAPPPTLVTVRRKKRRAVLAALTEPSLQCQRIKCSEIAALVCPSCGALCAGCAQRHHRQGIAWHVAEPLVVTADVYSVAQREPPLSDTRLDDVMDVNEGLFRYNRWLWLRRGQSGRLLIPTDDIEAMWRCHMLHPLRYAADTTALFGHPLPYDFHLAEQQPKRIAAAYARTSALWERTFGEEYELPEEHSAELLGA
eukprot:EG_transcript_22774